MWYFLIILTCFFLRQIALFNMDLHFRLISFQCYRPLEDSMRCQAKKITFYQNECHIRSRGVSKLLEGLSVCTCSFPGLHLTHINCISFLIGVTYILPYGVQCVIMWYFQIISTGFFIFNTMENKGCIFWISHTQVTTCNWFSLENLHEISVYSSIP